MYGVFRLFISHATLSDFKIYRIEGMAIRHGWGLYGHLPGVEGYATYPPFAAIVFVPASLLPLQLSSILMVLSIIAMLVWVAFISCRLAGASPERALKVGLLISAIGLWSEPVFKTLGYGQVNMLLIALVLWDFTRPAESRARGIGVGLAAGIKVTPGIFIVYLLLTRRWRFAATAFGTFAATLGLSSLIAPRDTWRYWTDYLFDPHRVGRLENAVNQTVRGMLVRMDHTRDTRPTELILVLVVLVAGLACATLAYRVLGDRWGLPAAAITGLLASPIAWSHHWVWYLPLLALIWFQARRWIVPTVLIFQSFAVWAIPHENSEELKLSRFQIAISNWYILFGLGFLVLTAVEIRRRSRSDGDWVFDDRSEEVAAGVVGDGRRPGTPR
jgi:alpha-1,2-mannosyltransferase